MLSYQEAQRFHVHVDIPADISGHREIPPLGFSYDKFLKAYGYELMKGQFPYEYMDDGRKLDEPALPPKETFHRISRTRCTCGVKRSGATTV